MDLKLQGQLVVRQEYGYTDLLETDGNFEIRIENDYTISLDDGAHHFSPKHFNPGLELPNLLLDRTISSSIAEADGTLNIGFDNGGRLKVPPHKTYEAWTLAGPQGQKVVCMPGGELAIWQPTEGND
jgi:hypothetical protein